MPHRTRRFLAATAAAAAFAGALVAAPAAGAAPTSGPTPTPDGVAGTSAVAAARAQLAGVVSRYGVTTRDLRTLSSTQVAGRAVVRFQQTRAGLPVLGGQLVTVLDARHRMLSVSGETARSALPAAPAYEVAASSAADTARRVAGRAYGVAPSTLRTDRPTRWLLDPSLLDPRAAPRLRPVWRVPVHSTERADLRELVLVDAATGRVAMRFPEVAHLDRVVCDDVRIRSYRCRPGGYDRVEGGAAIGVADADQAYELTGVTATWYAAGLGVDLTTLIGTDQGDGVKLRSTTNYCPPGECPLQNAFWSGDQMVYGAGYTAADDVVAHELTHGVTQHTAGLVYWYQSGAINESMSDVFGELVDQGDGVGNDSPEVRWRLGEDLPAALGGVTRDMADPTRYGQPDTTTSPNYDLALDYDDNGAVHTNSGVPNKTAYLITDGTAAEPGGAFAGSSFAGIGAARAATLYWATLQMLTPGSDFQDLAAALQQACANLAYTPYECATVAAAVAATGLARGTGPSEPRRVVMRGGPSEVLLSWAPPASVGSSPLTSYAVAVSPAVHGDDLATVDPASDSWVLTGLAPGVDYTVRLFAVNADGTSPSVSAVLRGTAAQVTAPVSVLWSSRAAVSGRLVDARGTGLRGRRVFLARRDAGTSSYDMTGSAVTSADGSFAFSWSARRSTKWFVLYQGTATEIGVRGLRHDLAVQQRVSVAAAGAPRSGQLLLLTGTVRPLRDGVVQLQRHTGDGWRSVARGRLADGRWSVSWRITDERPTDLRVRVAARPKAGLAAGLSRVLHLDPR